MTSTPAQRTLGDIGPAHPEVEFALVLARTIDSVNSDPQQLRTAIYELARQKPQQLAHQDPREKARLMFEVRPRDDAALSPGRYALILKAQAYDLTVEGAVTDKRHCLQRKAAANGVFYSECEKP
ncbi:hypothetical protein [Bradyrhizobium sp. USDA 4454]